MLSSASAVIERLRKWRLLCYFVLASSALVLPWFIRNCIVLEALLPTGTHGFIGLASVYSDEGYEHEGEWIDLRKGYFHDAGLPEGLTGAEKEKLKNQYCRKRVIQWVRDNPNKVVKFTITKISRFWVKGGFHVFVVLLSLLGMIIYRGYPEGKVFLGLLLCCTLQIALTYLNHGQFKVPILSLIHVTAATGLWAIVQLATNREKAFRQSLFPERNNLIP